jgi:hypothetical protein
VSEAVQMWLFGILGGGEVAIFLWIYAHSVRDAKREAKVDELTQEVGHQTVHGSILERLHRYGGYIRDLMSKLGMDFE